MTASLKDTSDFVYGMPGPNALVSATRSGYDCVLACQTIIVQPTEVTLSKDFSTVTTGISTGRYYYLSIGVLNYGSYFMRVQAGSITKEITT